MSQDMLKQLTASLVDGDREQSSALTRQALDAGLEPMSILDDALIPGMRIVGERFTTGEYFLPNLIVSAACMKQAMQLLEPELRARHQAARTLGRVVIGTVRGDIHEIGKTLVATMLSANGFEVRDLGVDVPIERFVAEARDHDADIVGLSALLTTTMGIQRQVIEALGAAGLRHRVKVMVGGAPVSRSWADAIGADGYAEDAVGAVDTAKRLLGVAPR